MAKAEESRRSLSKHVGSMSSNENLKESSYLSKSLERENTTV